MKSPNPVQLELQVPTTQFVVLDYSLFVFWTRYFLKSLTVFILAYGYKNVNAAWQKAQSNRIFVLYAVVQGYMNKQYHKQRTVHIALKKNVRN